MANVRGCIGFVDMGRSNTFFGWGIRFVTASKWSHSFVVIDEETVLEANKRVEETPLSFYRNHPNASYELYRIVKADPDRVTRAIGHICRVYTGNEYGYLQIPFFLFRAVYRWLGKQYESKTWTAGTICSELVYVYQELVADWFVGVDSSIDSDTCSPQDLYEIVKANPDCYQLIERK